MRQMGFPSERMEGRHTILHGVYLPVPLLVYGVAVHGEINNHPLSQYLRVPGRFTCTRSLGVASPMMVGCR